MTADPTTSPAIVVAGWIGSTNLGDELVASALTSRLTSRGFRVVAPSLSPENTKEAHGIFAFDYRSLSDNRRVLQTSSALLFGGGGLVSDDTSQLNLPYHLSRPWYARRVGLPFGGIGLGVGPLKTRFARKLSRHILIGARVLGTRDTESADLLRSLGLPNVVEAADLALSLPTPEVQVGDVIAVSLRPPVPGGVLPVASSRKPHDDAWLSAAAKALDETAIATGLGVRFVAMQTDRDRAVHDAVHERMTTAASHADPTLASVLSELASARVVVGMRYHAGIGALIGGRPAVMLKYTSKVDSLVAQVGDGFTGLNATTTGFSSVPAAVENVLGQPESDLFEARNRLRQIEARNESVLDQVLAP